MVRNGMSSKWLSLAVAAGAWCAANACATPAIADEARPAEAKITYTENVQAIFREHCYTCHNQDQAKSDLALDSYAATMRGGAGGEVVLPGDLESSRLWALVAHIETPKMPPEQDKLPQEKLDVIKKWILGGALESAGSKAKMAKKPKIDLNVTASAKKPEGPPPMPEGLFRQPFVTSKRPGAITAMATSPWAPLAAVSGQKQILLFNTDTAQMIGILPFPEGSPQVLQFSRNGSVLLCAGGRHGASGKVVLYDVKKGTRLTEIGDEVDTVLAADISPDQSLVVLGGPRKIIRVYDVADGSLEYESRKHTDWIYSAEFSPDGKYLATGDRAGGILIWEAETGREYQNLTGHTAGITGLSWRTDSKTLASSSEDGTVKVWDIDGGKALKSWSAHNGGALAVRFAPDGRLISGGRDKKAQLWDQQGKALQGFAPMADNVMKVGISFDGKRALAGDWTGQIQIFDATNGKLLAGFAQNPPTLEMLVKNQAAELPSVEAAAKQAIAERDALRKQVADARANLAKADKDAKTNLDEINALKVEVPRADGKLKQAGERLDRAKQKLADAQRVAKEVQSAKTPDEKKVTEAKTRVEAAQKELNEATTAKQEAQKDRDAKAAKLASNQGRVGALKSSFESQQKALPNLEKALAEKEAAAKSAEEREVALRTDLERSKAEQAAYEKARNQQASAAQ